MTSKIQDLDFLEMSDESMQIRGGVEAQVNVSVSTSWNLASASSRTTAFGNQTLTWSQTTTKVNYTSFSINSYARADGTAFAESGINSALAKGTEISSSSYVDYVKS